MRARPIVSVAERGRSPVGVMRFSGEFLPKPVDDVLKIKRKASGIVGQELGHREGREVVRHAARDWITNCSHDVTVAKLIESGPPRSPFVPILN